MEEKSYPASSVMAVDEQTHKWNMIIKWKLECITVRDWVIDIGGCDVVYAVTARRDYAELTYAKLYSNLLLLEIYQTYCT